MPPLISLPGILRPHPLNLLLVGNLVSDGNQMLFSYSSSGQLSLLSTYQVRDSFVGLSVTPDGSYILIADSHADTAIIHHDPPGAFGPHSIYELEGFTLPRGIAVSPDGGYVAMALFDTASPVPAYDVMLLDFDPVNMTVVETYDSGFGEPRGKGVEFTPNGDYLFFVGSPVLLLLHHDPPGTLSLASTYTPAGNVQQAAISSDGSYIALGHDNTPYFTLLYHNPPGTLSLAATYTNPGAVAGFGTAFSPDDRYIGVGWQGDPGFTLLNHSPPGTLSFADEYATDTVLTREMSFSPDGRFIAIAEHNSDGGLLILRHQEGTVSFADRYIALGAFGATLPTFVPVPD